MTVEIISWSISTKVWDRAEIELLEMQSDSHLLPDTWPTALRGPVADDSDEISNLICYFWKSSKIWNCHLLKIVGGALRAKKRIHDLLSTDSTQEDKFTENIRY